MLEENVRCWGVSVGLGSPDENRRGDGWASVVDRRTGARYTWALYRFPAGWRASYPSAAPVPKYVKATADRLMRRLP